MHTIRQTLTADWGPPLESAARQLAAVLVAAYVAGYCLGAFVHRLSAALAAWASKPHRLTVKPATIAEPVASTGPVTISAAVWLQAGGLSSREIAEILQVSRSTVRRQLQAT
jgi:DNA-binding NarL/FixJ family response regulator